MMRALAFWGVCIPLRTWLSTLGDVPILRAFALYTGWRWLAGLNDSRRGFFGGRAWWASARPVHGVLWSLYGATGKALFLKIDTLFGATLWFLKD
jgi:hypothetical protein|tara:strand:- start:6501 stop:6785 length:285 start_codon:yes stop_codon:yes gene_type:complete